MPRDSRRRSPESSRRRRKGRRDSRDEPTAPGPDSTMPGPMPGSMPEDDDQTPVETPQPRYESQSRSFPDYRPADYPPQSHYPSQSFQQPYQSQPPSQYPHEPPQQYQQYPPSSSQQYSYQQYPSQQFEPPQNQSYYQPSPRPQYQAHPQRVRPPGGHSSDSSSTSSSFLNISRRKRFTKYGNVFTTFFRAPSEAGSDRSSQRAHRKKKRTTFLSFNNSSSSSVDSDLAYGRGYIPRDHDSRASATGARHAPGAGSSQQQSRDPRRPRLVDPNQPAPPNRTKTDDEILEIGRQLSDIARKQNDADLRASGKGRPSQLVAAAAAVSSFRRSNTGDSQRNRGIGSSRPHGDDGDSEWEDASEDEGSSDDGGLAYGSGAPESRKSNSFAATAAGGAALAAGAAGLYGLSQQNGNRRHSSQVDPRLFGPQNSLRGLITPVPDDPRQQDANRHEPRQTPREEVPPPASSQRSSTRPDKRPMQHVYPVPTSDPNNFDYDRGSVSQTQSSSRPAPVPIQQPVPVAPVSSRVYEADSIADGTRRHETKHGRSKSDGRILAGTAAAGVAAAAIGAAVASGRSDSRDYRRDDRRDDRRYVPEASQPHDRDRRERDGRSYRDQKVRIVDDRDQPRATPDDDPYNAGLSRRHTAPVETLKDYSYRLPQGDEIRVEYDRDRGLDRNRRQYSDVRERAPEDRSIVAEQRQKSAPSEPPVESKQKEKQRVEPPEAPSAKAAVDPFQFQVDDFHTPPVEAPRRPLTPQVFTVEREPDFSGMPAFTQPPPAADIRLSRKDSFEIEQQIEEEHRKGSRARSRTPEPRRRHAYEEDEHAASSILDEAKHATAPVAAAAFASAIAVENARTRERQRSDVDSDGSRSRSAAARDAVLEDADRYYRESVIARKIAEDELRSRSASPNKDHSVIDKYQEEEQPNIVTIVPPPAIEEEEDEDPSKHGPFAAPNADVRIDNTIVPRELSRFRIPEGHLGDGRDPFWKSRDPSCERDRPLLNLVTPTPIATPTPERQARSADTSNEDRTSEVNSVQDVIIGPRGEIIQTPSTPKSVTWGENETKSFEPDSPDASPSDDGERGSKSRPKLGKGSGWGILAAALTGGSMLAQDNESKDRGEETSRSAVDEPRSHEYRTYADEEEPPVPGPKPASPIIADASPMPGSFGNDNEFAAVLAAGLQDTGFDPNIVIDDPTYRRRDSPPGSNGAFYHHPTAETVTDLGVYAEAPRDGPSSDAGFVIGEVDTPTQEQEPEDDWASTSKLSKKDRKKREKAAKRQSTEGDDVLQAWEDQIPQPTPGTPFNPAEEVSLDKLSKKERKKREKAASREVVVVQDEAPAQPQDDWASSQPAEPVDDDWAAPTSSKKKKGKKGRKSIDVVEESEEKSVSVPVDAFDDLVKTAEPEQMTDEWDAPKKSKKKSKRDSAAWDSPSRPASEVSVGGSKKDRRKSSDYAEPDDYVNDRDGDPPDRGRHSFIDDRDVTSVVSDPASKYDRHERRSNGTRYDDDDTRSVTSFASAPDGRKSSKDAKRGKGLEKRSSGSFFGLFGRNGSDTKLDEKRKSDKDQSSFLDNAGTLGAGVGMAGAAAALGYAASRQNANDAPLDEEPSAGPETRAVDYIDPEIVERVIKPAIDPQYGDLLPLPPSEPSSPKRDLSDDEQLPALPDSRPETPPEERNRLLQKPTHARRRSALDTPIKSPSHTAIPLQLRLGQRSSPASPGFFRSSPVASPEAVAAPELTTPKRPARPTSWDSSREIKPLYLLESSRQGSQIYDDETTLHLPELPPSETSGSSRQSPAPVSEGQDIDQLTGGSLPLRLDTDQPAFTLPTYSGSQETTPKAELPRDPLSVDVHSALVDDAPLPVGGDGKTDDRSLVPNDELSELPPLPQSTSKSPGAEDEGSPYPVEPMSKDRSSYLLYSTPPSVKKGQHQREQSPGGTPTKPVDVMRDIQEETAGEDAEPRKSGIWHAVAGAAAGGLAAAGLWAAADTEGPKDGDDVVARDAEAEPAGDEWAAPTPSKKKKGKKGKKSSAVEELPADTPVEAAPEAPVDAVPETPVDTALPAVVEADPAEEFSEPKLSKKDKKKKKKAQSSQALDDWAEPTEVPEVSKSVDVEEPAADPAPVDSVEPASAAPTEEQPIVDEFAPVSKKDKKKKKKAQAQAQADDWSEAQEVQDAPKSLDKTDLPAAEPASTPAAPDVLETDVQKQTEEQPVADDFAAPVSKKDKKKKKKSQAQAFDDWSEPQEATETPVAAETPSADVAGEPSAPAVEDSLPAESQPADDASPAEALPSTDDFAPISKKDKKKKKKSQAQAWDDWSEPQEAAESPAAEIASADVTGERSATAVNEPVSAETQPVEDPAPTDDFAPISKKDKKKKRKSQVSWDDPPLEESGEASASLDTQAPATEDVKADAPGINEEQVPVDDFAPLSKKDKKKKKKSQPVTWDDPPAEESQETPASLDDTQPPVVEAGEADAPVATEEQAPADDFAPISKKDKKKKKKSQGWDPEPDDTPKSLDIVETPAAEPASDMPAAGDMTPTEPQSADPEDTSAPLSKKDKKKKRKSQLSSWDDAGAAEEAPKPVEDVDQSLAQPSVDAPAAEPAEPDFAPVSKKDKKKKKKSQSSWDDFPAGEPEEASKPSEASEQQAEDAATRDISLITSDTPAQIEATEDDFAPVSKKDKKKKKSKKSSAWPDEEPSSGFVSAVQSTTASPKTEATSTDATSAQPDDLSLDPARTPVMPAITESSDLGTRTLEPSLGPAMLSGMTEESREDSESVSNWEDAQDTQPTELFHDSFDQHHNNDNLHVEGSIKDDASDVFFDADSQGGRETPDLLARSMDEFLGGDAEATPKVSAQVPQDQPAALDLALAEPKAEQPLEAVPWSEDTWAKPSKKSKKKGKKAEAADPEPQPDDGAITPTATSPAPIPTTEPRTASDITETSAEPGATEPSALDLSATADDEWASTPTSKSSKKQKKKSKQKASAADPWDAGDAAETSAPADQGSSTADEPAALQEPSTSGDAPAAEDLDFTSADKGKKKKKKNRKSIAFDVEGGEPSDAPPTSTADALSTSPTLGAETTGNLNESAAGGPSDAEAHSSRSGDDGSLVPLAEPRGGEALAAAGDSGAADRAETTVDLTKPLDGAEPIDPAAPPDDAPQYGQDKAQGPQDDTSPEATQGRDAQAVEPVLTDSEQGVGAPQELPGPALADTSLTSELPQTDRSLGETQDQVDTTDGPKNDDMAVSEALPARPDDEWQATTTTKKGKKDKKKKRQSLAFADEETPEAAPAVQDGPVTETAEPALDDWASETIAKADEAPKDDDIWSEAATTGKKGKKNKKKKGSSAFAWDEGDSRAADESKSGQDAAPEEETAQPDAAPVDESDLAAVPAAEESVPASTAGAEDDEWAAPTTGKKAKKNKKKKGSSAVAWDDAEASQTPEDSKAEPEILATEQSSQPTGATTTTEDLSAAPAAAEEPLPAVPAEAGEDEWATPTSGKKAKKGKKKKDTSAFSWDEPEPSPAVEEQAPTEEAAPLSEAIPEAVLDKNPEEPPTTAAAEPADDAWGFATTSKKGKKNKKNKGLAAWEDTESAPAEPLASTPSQPEDTASHDAPADITSQHDAPLPAEEGSADPAAVSAEAPVPEEPSIAAEAGEDEWAAPTVGKKGKKNKKNKTAAAAASDPWDEPQPSVEAPAEPAEPVEASPAQEDDPFDMPGSKKSKKNKKKQSLLATSLDDSASPLQEPSEELGEAAKPEPAAEDEWSFEPAGKKSKKDKKKRQSLAFADLGETPDGQATESPAAESQNEEAKAADPSEDQPAEAQDAPPSDVPVVDIPEEAPPASSGDVPEPAANNDADETATPSLDDEFPMTTKKSKKDKKKKKAAASFDEVTEPASADVTPDVQDEAPAVPESEPQAAAEEDFGFAPKKSKKDKKKKKAAAFDEFQEQPVEAPQPSAPSDDITEPAPTDAVAETTAETAVVPEVEAKPAEDDEFGFVSKKSKKDKKKKKAAAFDDFQDQPDISQPPADDVPEPTATEDAPEPAPTDASPLPEPQDAALPEAEPKPAEKEDFDFVAKKSKKDKKKKKGLAIEDPAWAVEAETNPVQDDQAAAPEQPVESAGTSGVDEPSAPSAEDEFAPVGKKDKKKKKKGLLVAALTSSLLGEADANASAEEPSRSLPVEESPDASAQDAPVAEAGAAEAEPAANAEDEFPMTKKSKKDKKKKGKAAEPFEAEPDSQTEPAPEPSNEPAAIPEPSFGQNVSSSWADEVEESLDQDPTMGDTKDLPADNQIDSTAEAPAQPEATQPEEDFGFSSKKSKKDKKNKKGLSQSGIDSPLDLTTPIDEPSLETAPVDTAPSTEPAAGDWPEETFVTKKSKKDKKKKKGSQLDDVATPAESPTPLEPTPEAPNEDVVPDEAPPAEPEAATTAATDAQPAVADEWPEDSFVAKKSKKDKKKKKSKLQDDFDTPSGAVTPADEALPKLDDDNTATASNDTPAEVVAPELPSESAAEPQDLSVAPTESQQAETSTIDVDQPSAPPEQATTEWPEETFVTKKSKKDKKKKRASQFEPELEPEPVSQNEARADAQELQQDPQVRDSSREAPLETADGGMPAEEAPVSTEDWDDFSSTKKGKKKKKGKAVALADFDSEPAAPEPVPEAIVDDQAAMLEPPLEGNDSTQHDSPVSGAQAEQDIAAESTAPVPETQKTPVADEWSDFTAKKTKKGKKKNKAIALDPEPAMESVDTPPEVDAPIASDRVMDVDTGDVPVNVEADQPVVPVEASSTPADEQPSAPVDEWADFSTKKGKKKKKGKAAVVEAEPEPEVAVAAAELSNAPEPLSRDLDSAADAPVPAGPEAVAEADLAAADNIASEPPTDEWADLSTKKSKKKKKGKGAIVDEPEPSSESATPADPDTNATPEQAEDIPAAMDAPALPAEESQAAADDWADFTTTKKSKKGKKKSKMAAWDESEPAQQEQFEPAPEPELPALEAADDAVPAVVEEPQLAEPETAAPAPTEEQPTPAADDWPEFSTKKSKKDKKKKKAAQSLDWLDDVATPAPTTETAEPVQDEAMTDAPAVTEETTAPVAVPFDAADEMPLDAPRSLDNDVVASADPQHEETESAVPLNSSPADVQPVADAQAEDKPEQADDSSDFFSVKKSKKDKKKKRGSQLQFEEPLPSQEEPALSVEAQDSQPASEAITEPTNESRDMAVPVDEPEETFVLKKSKKDKKKAKKQSSVAESDPPTLAESAPADTSAAILDVPMAAEPEQLPQDDTTPPEVDQNPEAIPAIEDEWALPSKKKKGKKGKGSVSVNSAPVSRALSPIRDPDVTMADDLPREEAAVPSAPLVEEVLPQPEPAVEDEWALPTSSKKKKKGKKGMAFASDSPEPSSRALSPTRDMDALGDTVSGGEQQQAEPAQNVDTPMVDAEPAAEDEWALPTSGKKKKKGKKGMAFASLESSGPPPRALSPTREIDAPEVPEADQQAEPSQITDTPMVDAEPAAEDEWALPSSSKKKKKGKKGKNTDVPEPEPAIETAPVEEPSQEPLPEPEAETSEKVLEETIGPEPAAQEPTEVDAWGITPSKKSKKDKKRAKASATASRSMSPTLEDPQDIPALSAEPSAEVDAQHTPADNWDVPVSSKKSKKGKKGKPLALFESEQPATEDDKKSSTPWGEIGAAAAAGTLAAAALAGSSNDNDNQVKEMASDDQSRDVPAASLEKDESLDAKSPYEATPDDNPTGDADQQGMYDDVWGEDTRGNEDMDDVWGGDTRGNDDFDDVWGDEPVETKSRVASDVEMLWGGSSTPKKSSTPPKSGKSVETPKAASKADKTDTPSRSPKGAAAAADATPKSAVGKKKKGKSKKRFEGKTPGGGDDLFDDPVLWEGSDKKHISEAASVEVERFWGPGEDDNDEAEQTAKDTEKNTIAEEEEAKPTPADKLKREEVDDIESPVLGSAAQEDSFAGPAHVEEASERETQQLPTENTESMEIDQAIDRGFEAEQQRDLGAEAPADNFDNFASPYSSPMMDFRRSKSRGLPPVQEESDDFMAQPAARSLDEQAPETPQPDRDSGFIGEVAPSVRRSNFVDPELRDSGVHLREHENTSRQAPPRSPEPSWPTTPSRSLQRADEAVSSTKPKLRRSPLSKGELRESPLTKTPKLREPGPYDITPEPQKSRHFTPEPTDKRSRYGEVGLSAGPAASSLSGRRSVSDHVARIQSPAPPDSASNRSLRRTTSNTSLTRQRTPEPLNISGRYSAASRPESPASGIFRGSSATPPLRRVDKRVSGDLRSLSQRSQVDLATPSPSPGPSAAFAGAAALGAAGLAAAAVASTNSSSKDKDGDASKTRGGFTTTTPVANEGRVRAKDMPDIYDGVGEGRIGSPRSPTRPHSMRRRQSMQVLDLESRVEQLTAENRLLAEAKAQAEAAHGQHSAGVLADRDAEIDQLKQSLEFLQKEVARLTEVNDGLNSANAQLASQHNERHRSLEAQHGDASRGSFGAFESSLGEKDAEISRLRGELEQAKEQIRAMQQQILNSKAGDSSFLKLRDVDHFDHRCQQLCSHVQQWVLRFSKFSDMRACRLTSEINDEKVIDRLDNAVLDGFDVDTYLGDRVKRRDIFMSMTMNMIWEFVFTRYLFGMDREQRQKLKSLEKLLTEVGPPQAVRQWRAVTLTLLSKRPSFREQRDLDTEAVVQAIFHTLSKVLPPPSNLEDQIQSQLRRVMREAVDLSVEMRTQRAEYMMLPPLQPTYDEEGELAETVTFNASLMNERSGDATLTNEDLEAKGAVVRVVLFPLVVKKGDDAGEGDDEIVVCPAQVLVQRSHDKRRSARLLTPSSDVGGALLGTPTPTNRSDISMVGGGPIYSPQQMRTPEAEYRGPSM